MSTYVFAYGSNMCSGRFRDYGVSPERPGVAAVLSGYELRFNKRSQDGSGKANIEPLTGMELWGVLYTVSDADLKKLDQGEVGYRRSSVTVRLADMTLVGAWVYVAVTPVTPDETPLLPYEWYKRFLVEGAREHGLPNDYVTLLEAVKAIHDADSERDRQKRALNCHGGA